MVFQKIPCRSEIEKIFRGVRLAVAWSHHITSCWISTHVKILRLVCPVQRRYIRGIWNQLKRRRVFFLSLRKWEQPDHLLSWSWWEKAKEDWKRFEAQRIFLEGMGFGVELWRGDFWFCGLHIADNWLVELGASVKAGLGLRQLLSAIQSCEAMQP
jgi:hypothetical protein